MGRSGRAVLTLAGLILGGEAAAAQSTITGVLFDSLRTGAPVPAATVSLLGTGRRATTDSRGVFHFSDVTPGEHRVAYWAPWLDSIALPALERRAVVTERGVTHIEIATPSKPTFERAVCGSVLDLADGILIGAVHSPDGIQSSGVEVAAQWTVTTLWRGSIRQFDRAAIDTTASDGLFALCGVPRDAPFTLRASLPVGARVQLEASLDHRVVARQDLLLSAGGESATLVGIVRGIDGSPIAGASVAVDGPSLTSTRTDSTGGFTLTGVPRQTVQLRIRAVGHVPRRSALDVREPDLDVGAVVLHKLPQLLDGVVVSERLVSTRRLEFEERRRFGIGTFIPDEELAKLPVVTASAVAAMVPRSVAVGRAKILLARGPGYCTPRVFVDGADEGQGADLLFWLQVATRIEVYRAANAPPRFNDFDGCGSIVIWTR